MGANPDEPLAVVDVQSDVTPYIQQVLRSMPGLDAAMADEVADQALVGVAVGIAEGQDIVYLQGFGLADIENDVAVDPEATLFRWGSVSKGVTGIAALQASLDGDLDLDADVRDYVSEYPGHSTYLPDGCDALDCAEPLTAAEQVVGPRMLLLHAGGAPHYQSALETATPPTSERNDPDINTGMAWALDYWVHQPAVNVPGSAYHYSSFGYNLAGVAIERATGERLGDLVTSRIAEPIGADTLQPHTIFDPLPNEAVGYDMDDGVLELDGNDDISWKLASASFVSSAQDMTRYCSALMDDVLLDPVDRDGTLWHAADPDERYGLGFGIGGSDSDRYINHSGSVQGGKAVLVIRPERDTCIAVVTNSMHADVWDLLDVVLDHAE